MKDWFKFLGFTKEERKKAEKSVSDGVEENKSASEITNTISKDIPLKSKDKNFLKQLLTYFLKKPSDTVVRAFINNEDDEVWSAKS